MIFSLNQQNKLLKSKIDTAAAVCWKRLQTLYQQLKFLHFYIFAGFGSIKRVIQHIPVNPPDLWRSDQIMQTLASHRQPSKHTIPSTDRQTTDKGQDMVQTDRQTDLENPTDVLTPRKTNYVQILIDKPSYLKKQKTNIQKTNKQKNMCTSKTNKQIFSLFFKTTQRQHF